MTGPREDDPTPAPGDRTGRRLSEPPSARYGARDTRPQGDASGAGPSALTRPLRLATVVALLGAAAFVLVGGILASTTGLLFVAGVTGAVIGLVLARAAVPPDDDPGAPVPRERLKRLAVVLALGAVAVGAAGTWVVALLEGGVLGPIDYLITTFGPFLPAEALLAALGAWWGASSGPITG